MKTILSFITFVILFNTSRNLEMNDLHFLVGTWKVENKENYETWSLKEKDALEGTAHKIRNGNKVIEEYLSIKRSGENIVYKAKVVNQNNGRSVEFILNKSIKNKYSFENLTHDFPKKIQYTKRNDSTLFVSVLGKDDKGFSYTLIKLK